MIGHLAHEYHLLPSEVAERATAFDIMVTDVYTAWERQQLNPSDSSQYRTEDLQAIFNNARGVTNGT